MVSSFPFPLFIVGEAHSWPRRFLLNSVRLADDNYEAYPSSPLGYLFSKLRSLTGTTYTSTRKHYILLT